MKAFFDVIGIVNLNYGWVYQNMQAKDRTTWMILLGFIIVLFFNNSMKQMSSFKCNKIRLYFNIILFLIAISLVREASEFLYFNF